MEGLTFEVVGMNPEAAGLMFLLFIAPMLLFFLTGDANDE